MLMNTAKCHGYSFCRFWVIKGKPTGGWGYPPDYIYINIVQYKVILKATTLNGCYLEWMIIAANYYCYYYFTTT